LTEPTKITAAEVNTEFLLAKCDYFLDIQLWPLLSAVNPRFWLENFLASERAHAIHLLNSFMYFSEPLVDEMFKAAVQRLSMRVVTGIGSLAAAQTAWQTFISSAIVTYVTGEMPNPSDSGFTFARKARQVLGISEAHIVHPSQALEVLLTGSLRPIVFVDDFVGSGNQFVHTWKRLVLISGSQTSFERIAALHAGAPLYYCPLLCTETGLAAINKACPGIAVSPAHILSSRYSAFSAESIFWPKDLQATATEFIRQASDRAGIPDNNGRVNDWRGFRKLGLAIAFAHSVPDATLPLFYWEQRGWRPLVRRR
jgi:hypothetical protein